MNKGKRTEAKMVDATALLDASPSSREEWGHTANPPSATSPHNYYDIVLVGRTGKGKSTLGNKLIAADARFECGSAETRSDRFLTADEVEYDQRKLTVTTQCKLLVNETTKVRVLDTPGLSATFPVPLSDDNLSTNLQTCRKIVFNQLKHNLAVKRLLYFLPVRGILDKADGAMQEELRMMYHFFGDAFLDLTVLVATQEKEYQQYEFTEANYDTIQKVFSAAIRTATEGKCTSSPPVVYVGIDDNEKAILARIKDVGVLASPENVFIPAFRDYVCTRCSCQVRFNESPSGNRIAIGIVREGDLVEKYEDSKCHPSFAQRYIGPAKFFGGIAHVATFGIVYAIGIRYGRKPWPWFTDSDEICTNCRNPPGSDPCHQVMKEYRGMKVTHSNEFDQMI